jgi:hypothetical protein
MTVNKTLIFLDDVRNPFENDWLAFSPVNDYQEVIWLKDYYQFVDYIDTKGLPYVICFDHDLGTEDEKTGYDAAKYLVDYCLDRNLSLPLYNIQSANPVGKANIDGVLKSYQKYFNNNAT